MKVRIGTRGSRLALAQANAVRDFLKDKQSDNVYEIEIIKSDGDVWQGTDSAANKDKKKWTGVLEKVLLAGHVDFLIHSAKDVPAEISSKTSLIPLMDRKSPYDVFIGKKVGSERVKFGSLKDGAKIGTASARRRTQILSYNDTFEVVPHRGNVPTRIEKLDNSSDLNGIIIAEAGLIRLGYSASDYEVLDTSIILPAVNQGIVVAQYLSGNEQITNLLSLAIEEKNQICFLAERYIIEKVDASCHSAISVFAKIIGAKLELSVVVIGQNSKRKIIEQVSGNLPDWKSLAKNMCSILHQKNINILLNEESCL